MHTCIHTKVLIFMLACMYTSMYNTHAQSIWGTQSEERPAWWVNMIPTYIRTNIRTHTERYIHTYIQTDLRIHTCMRALVTNHRVQECSRLQECISYLHTNQQTNKPTQTYIHTYWLTRTNTYACNGNEPQGPEVRLAYRVMTAL